jgi:hypothetical protein
MEAGAAGGAYERALVTAEVYYPMWAELTDCLCRGGSAAEMRPTGELTAGPEFLTALFDRTAEDLTEPEAKRVAATCELPDRAVVVDVGGRSDALLTEMLQAHPGCRGVLYDLPGGTDRARSSLGDAGLAARTDVAEGDFLIEVPGGGDVYLLSFVLHAWDDDHATAVLRAVRAAMHPASRLLIVERPLVAEGEDAEVATLHDLHMLVTTGGRERTEDEYVALLGEAGLARTATIDTGGRNGVIEARPVG